MRRTAFILAALALTIPAAAQDGSEAAASRTPDNARKFLAQLPDRYLIEVNAKGSLDSGVGYRVTTFRKTAECIDQIDGLPRWYVLRSSAETMVNNHLGNRSDANLLVPHQALITARGIPLAPYRIDWASTDPVENATSADGQPYERVLELSTKDLRVRVQFPSIELTERAKLAMETLRVACDSSVDTGF